MLKLKEVFKQQLPEGFLPGSDYVTEPVSEVALFIKTENIHETVSELQHFVLQWIEERSREKLPKDAWQGLPFNLASLRAQRSAATLVEQHANAELFWSAISDDEDKKLPRTKWTSEFAVAVPKKGKGALFGCKLTRISPVSEERGITFRSTPKLIRDIVAKLPCTLDGFSISGEAVLIEKSGKELDTLIELIRSPIRKHPVYVVTPYKTEEENGLESAKSKADKLASWVTGLAHVAVISECASWKLGHELSQEFTVFNGAVRTYNPGFDQNNSDPYDHPLALHHTVESWESGSLRGWEAFTRMLSQSAMETSTARGQKERIPSFANIKRLASQSLLQQAKVEEDQGHYLKLLENDNESLSSEVRELNALVEASYEDLFALEKKNKDLAAKYQVLNLHNSALKKRIKSNTASPVVSFPDSFNQIEEWCQEWLTGRVVITGRAINCCKKSSYETPSIVYKALYWLAEHYTEMRRGNIELKKTRKALKELNLEEDQTIDPTSAGQYSGYYIEYQGKKRLLERHIKKGKAKDPRRCMRIYYFFDQSCMETVVGSMPHHLNNSKS